MKLTKVALIPARSGSKRIVNKNISDLCGHPLLAYSIVSAIQSGIFDAVICATDDHQYAEIAKHYGAEVPLLRKKNTSGDKSPDILWIKWILEVLQAEGREFDVFSILRPTSPFRKVSTIHSAWELFVNSPNVDSLRAVEKCKQHPAKMWKICGDIMYPILPFDTLDTPWHSSQYASLPEVYVQNASLEIAWVRNVIEKGSISGNIIKPFITNDLEGYDINEKEDLELAKILSIDNPGLLPEININPYKL